ncbi:MAG TPA: phosphatidylinositol mannoside acyltransferase, partial [Actinotalea sp.]|nr:phosphatidylinositol mannoside acyltransferase [Actinotalea sp.]
MSLASRGMVAAVRLAPWVPEPVLRACAQVAADVTWWRRGAGVRRLEANLARVRADLTQAQVRALSREGMRTYLRYYAEAFALPGVDPDAVLARVRPEGIEDVFAESRAGRSVLLALGHQGNWDLAGVWATRVISPVTTVAERLEPEEVFRLFLDLREAIGKGLTVKPIRN